MALSNAVSNQSPRVNALYLNDVNDPGPGTVLASPSGSIVQPYYGQLGARLFLGTTTALALSDTAVGTLYEGIYQYVQLLATATAAPLRGALVVWSSRDNFVVTTDVTATTLNSVAGVLINVPTKGNYCFIQVFGKASVLFKATTTKTTPAIGDVVYVDATPANDCDVLADATALTSLNWKNYLGIAITAPVGGAISQISLRNAELCF